MTPIEQMAIEHGEETFSAISRNENGDAVVGVAYIFTKDELEAFAKSLQQPSEPVAKIIHTKGTGLLEGTTITKVMLDVKYVDLPEGTQLYTQPPNTVSLEQYNELLEQMEVAEAKIKALPRFNFLLNANGNGVARWENKSGDWIERYEVKNILEQAIEEAERSTK